MRPVHVLGRALWTPGFPSLAAFRAAREDADAERPPVSFVNSRNKRGCSILTLAAAEVAHQAAADAGVDPSEPALVFGSCHGEMEIAVAQMEMFREDKGLLSPQRFKNSVHNTGAGMFSIAVGNEGYATAIAAGHDTVAMSLLEAMLLLHHDRYEHAIVALADEALPAPLNYASAHRALGVAVVLGREAGASSRGTLSAPELSSEGAFAADTRFGGNPCAPLIAILDALEADAPREIPLSLAGGSPFACVVTPLAPGGSCAA